MPRLHVWSHAAVCSGRSHQRHETCVALCFCVKSDHYRECSVDVLMRISVKTDRAARCLSRLAFAQGLILQSASARGGRGSHFFGSNCRVLQSHMMACVFLASRVVSCTENMVPRGLEPRTFRLLAERSNQLSYETTWKAGAAVG